MNVCKWLLTNNKENVRRKFLTVSGGQRTYQSLTQWATTTWRWIGSPTSKVIVVAATGKVGNGRKMTNHFVSRMSSKNEKKYKCWPFITSQKGTRPKKKKNHSSKWTTDWDNFICMVASKVRPFFCSWFTGHLSFAYTHLQKGIKIITKQQRNFLATKLAISGRVQLLITVLRGMSWCP